MNKTRAKLYEEDGGTVAVVTKHEVKLRTQLVANTFALM